MSQPTLILASGSPRRSELLAEAGYEARVVRPRDGAEEAGICSNCGPAELVARLARCKWDDVADQLKGEPPEWMLAADTVASCRGAILGKPIDELHARSMIEMMSGREHQVFSGVCFGRSDQEDPEVRVVTTTLRMDEVSDQWIAEYIDSGLWEGKAGGFGYQDSLGFVHVTEGSTSNVVGLPMEVVSQMLQGSGVTPTN